MRAPVTPDEPEPDRQIVYIGDTSTCWLSASQLPTLRSHGVSLALTANTSTGVTFTATWLLDAR